MPNIIYISLIIVLLFIAFICWQYALLAHRTKQIAKNKRLDFKKNICQSWIDNERNVHRFWVSDCSGSMHEQKVFVVSPSDLGL